MLFHIFPIVLLYKNAPGINKIEQVEHEQTLTSGLSDGNLILSWLLRVSSGRSACASCGGAGSFGAASPGLLGRSGAVQSAGV